MRPHRRADRGAALVEFAFIVPILAAVVLGIIDFAAIYNDNIAVRQGGREGARQLVQGNGDTAAHNPPCGLTTGDFAPGGDGVGNTTAQRIFCMVKDRTDLDASDTRVAIRFEGNDHAVKRSATVCVAYPARSMTGFYGPVLDQLERVMRTSTQMRVQALFGDPGSAWGTTAAQLTLEEDYPFNDGQGAAQRNADWAWCRAETTAADT